MSREQIGKLDDTTNKIMDQLESNLEELRDVALASQDIVDAVKTICTDAVTNAPKQPGYTCPDIDAVVQMLKDVSKVISVAQTTLENNHLDHDFRNYGVYELDTCIDRLEDLRKANDQLRSFGDHYQNAVEEINKEVTV